MVDQDSIYLNGLNKMALALHPSGQADGDLRSLLLQAIERLWDARQERLLATQSTIPGIVWFVLIVGGALTVISARAATSAIVLLGRFDEARGLVFPSDACAPRRSHARHSTCKSSATSSLWRCVPVLAKTAFN